MINNKMKYIVTKDGKELLNSKMTRLEDYASVSKIVYNLVSYTGNVEIIIYSSEEIKDVERLIGVVTNNVPNYTRLKVVPSNPIKRLFKSFLDTRIDNFGRSYSYSKVR